MLQGARPVEVVRLLLEGNLSQQAIRNSMTALARGLVRPLRQQLAALKARRL
jgi:hypothetical protein